MKKICLLFLLILFSQLTFGALDDKKIGSVDEINVDFPLLDNFYISGGQITISESVDGDLIIAGGNLDISATVKGDIAAAGGDIRITSSNIEDVRIVGGNIFVDSNIKGDLIIAGGNIELAQDTTVGKDLIISGGQIGVKGRVVEDVVISGGTVDFDAQVDGNAKILAGSINVGENAHINGNLILSDGVFIEESIVDGEIQYLPKPDKEVSVAEGLLGQLFGKIMLAFTLIIIGLLIISFFTNYLEGSYTTLINRPWTYLLIGFAALVAIPVLALLLIITVIGIPLGLILLVIYALSILIALVLGSYLLGSLFFDKVYERKSSALVTLGVGVLLYILLGYVPLLGGIIKFIVLLFGLGLFYLGLHKPKKKKK